MLRIILALDLELWYLWSLKFITVIEILSPKVFMVRNMVSEWEKIDQRVCMRAPLLLAARFDGLLVRGTDLHCGVRCGVANDDQPRQNGVLGAQHRYEYLLRALLASLRRLRRGETNHQQ